MFSRIHWTCSLIKESVQRRVDLEKVNRHGRSMGQRSSQALFLVALMLLTPLSGCFGEGEGEGFDSLDDVVVTPATLIGGVFQGVTVSADVDVSAYVPYLMLNPDNGFCLLYTSPSPRDS